MLDRNRRSTTSAQRRWLSGASVLVALTLVSVFAVAGCGGDEEGDAGDAPAAQEGATETAPAEEVRIGLVIPDFTQNELILALKEGAEEAAGEVGAELMVEGSASAADMANAVENYLAAGVDVLVYDTIDAAALAPAIEQANAQGVPVVCVVSCAERGEHEATIMYDYREDMGRPLGDWIASELPEGGKVGIVDTNRADAAVAAIYDGMQDGLDAGGVEQEPAVSPPTNWDRAAALNIARNLLTANPDFDIVVGMHDLVAAATHDAMNEIGYNDVPLGGLGGTCEGLENILNDRQTFTVIQPLRPAGYEGIVAAAAIARGEELEEDEVAIPMIPMTRETADAILGGSEEGVIDGVDVGTMLERAEGGC